MEIRQTEEGDVLVFTVDGRIDSEGASHLERALVDAVMAGNHKMIIDMAQVSYVNSAALRVLADVLNANRENGGDLRLVAVSSRVRRVFEIIGFTRFFKDYDSVLAALEGF
ncbi:MAG: STAS domain-containing protein [Anaerolineae bacterium]|nr:STAS domain-containing protein [Anaerolineae bacterium]